MVADSGGSGALLSLSCASPAFCAASGEFSSEPLTVNGAIWTREGFNQFFRGAISCATEASCEVVPAGGVSLGS
jgi:hypothetical protein